jgi:flagellar biosynthesis protein FlhG
MKPFSEQDHYEVLEISRDATLEEIERAFRVAEAIYADESLAGYSVFGDGEAQAIRERVETAYRALTHSETRSAYDAMLDAAGPSSDAPEKSVEVAPARERERSVGVAAPETPRPVDDLEIEDDESGEYDGGRLRRSRIHRGIELEDIAGWTKINPTYLRFIEEDRYADLPAPVYVRGFVTAYAECVGLDGKRVATSYMQSFAGATTQGRRGRFLAGR